MLTAIRKIDNDYRSKDIKNINEFISSSEEIFKESIAGKLTIKRLGINSKLN